MVDRMSCPQRMSVLVELTCVLLMFICVSWLLWVGEWVSFFLSLSGEKPKPLHTYFPWIFLKKKKKKKTELPPGPCYPTSYQQGPLKESSDSCVHWWAEHKTLPSPIWGLLRLTVSPAIGFLLHFCFLWIMCVCVFLLPWDFVAACGVFWRLLSSGSAWASCSCVFSCCWALALGHAGFSSLILRAPEHRLNSCGGAWAQIPCRTWVPVPIIGIEATFPALQGRFLIAGKFSAIDFWCTILKVPNHS